jgi:1,4-alpha-glucan branching enzyme
VTALTADDIVAHLAAGALRDPFAVLGMHKEDGELVVRVFLPWATGVEVIDLASGEVVAVLPKVSSSGLFAGGVGRARPFPYRLGVSTPYGTVEIEDAYRFGPVLGEIDIYLLAEGSHIRSYDKLGAHTIALDGVEGVGFAVWAPNARSVNVVGAFNDWDGRRHPMRLHPSCGVWDLFFPGLQAGQPYKFEIHGPLGELLPLKADPYALQMECAPGTASVVGPRPSHVWRDEAWLARRWESNSREAPISIYEAHLGSWRRKPEEGNRYLSYRELADQLVPYVADLGFSHLAARLTEVL